MEKQSKVLNKDKPKINGNNKTKKRNKRALPF